MKKNRVVANDDRFWQAGKDVRIKSICKDIIRVCNDVERQPSTP